MSNRRRAVPCRFAVASGALILTCALLAGCASLFPDVCPAIGYSSTVAVTLENPRPDLTLEVCDGEDCVPGPPLEPQRIGGELEQRESDVAEVTGSSVDGWNVTFLTGGGSVLGYRLSDGSDAVGEGHAILDWVRVDGTERCGGNQRASVELPF